MVVQNPTKLADIIIICEWSNWGNSDNYTNSQLKQDPTVHPVAVLPQSAVEPYINTTIGNANNGTDYSVVAANDYSKGGIVVPSDNARRQGNTILEI